MNPRGHPGSRTEPDAETVKRREIVVAMADFLRDLGTAEGQALALKMGFPVELIPLLAKFNHCKMRMDEILHAWRNLTDNPSNQ